MEHEAVLFVNSAFYHAFANRDVTAMDALWAQRLPVACIHPGWGVLTGREAVMHSWRQILAGRTPRIVCRGAKAFVLGETAFVTCFETIEKGVLIATNIFAREDGAWKLVHHQAGPTADAPESGEPEEGGIVH